MMTSFVILYWTIWKSYL